MTGRAAFCLWIAFGTASAFAQDTGRKPEFDAASIKVVDRASLGHGGGGRMIGGPGTDDPGRFSVPVTTMVGLLMKAFDVENPQIIGPAWMRQVGGDFYELTATMPPDTTKAQFQAMLQNFLAERFHLAVHHESRNFPGYELVIDSGGTKLKDVSAQPDDGPAPAGLGADMVSARGGKITMKKQPMGDLAQRLGRALWTWDLIATQKMNSPKPQVVDKTGLTGQYSFVLEFSQPGPAMTPDADNPAGDLPDLFVVLRKQLGLRLNKTQGVPVDVIVVDNLDKVPVAN